MNKYHNIKSSGYDSKKEHQRACELIFMLNRGLISDFEQQVKFELIPAQYKTVQKHLKTKVKDIRICVEKSCSYIADFVYKDHNGETIVEDVKSPATRTEVYRIKKKLMLKVHGIEIKEI